MHAVKFTKSDQAKMSTAKYFVFFRNVLINQNFAHRIQFFVKLQIAIGVAKIILCAGK